MNSNSTMIRKLKNAINTTFDEKLLYSTSEFYSEQQERTVTIYSLKKQLEKEPGEKKAQKIELFNTTSQIQMVLFLRDYWYELNGWEVPKDNEAWNDAKEKYKKKKEKENKDVNNKKSGKKPSKSKHEKKRHEENM